MLRNSDKSHAKKQQNDKTSDQRGQHAPKSRMLRGQKALNV